MVHKKILIKLISLLTLSYCLTFSNFTFAETSSASSNTIANQSFDSNILSEQPANEIKKAEEPPVQTKNINTEPSRDPVVESDRRYVEKQKEITSLNAKFAPDVDQLDQLQRDRINLSQQLSDVTQQTEIYKQKLTQEYKILLDNPNHNITKTQTDYQSLWNKQHHLEQLLQANEDEIQNQKQTLADYQRKHQQMLDDLIAIQKSRDAARIARLNTELNITDMIEVKSGLKCDEDITIRQCAEQSRLLTLQKGMAVFQKQVLAGVTEQEVITQNANKLELNIRVIYDRVIDNGFDNTGTYTTHLSAQMQVQPSSYSACILLNLSETYCGKNSVTTNNIKTNSDSKTSNKIRTSASSNSDSKKWVQLTVRSKQFKDSVSINNIVYGSTPISLMVPANEFHLLVVKKPGYQTFTQKIKLEQNEVVWANLVEQDQGAQPIGLNNKINKSNNNAHKTESKKTDPIIVKKKRNPLEEPASGSLSSEALISGDSSSNFTFDPSSMEVFHK